ncbi:MAG TPA: hypothetical protein VIM19_16560 [Actinomycetes bacterium]
MTIDEAFDRVVRSHWLLIAICILLPVAAVLVLGSRQPATYEAVGRLQFGSTLASSNVEADAASTRAMGIVTSPGVVQQALSDAHLATDPVKFALDHIDVRRVGVSPVIEVAVSEQNPQTAALIATSLTNQLLKFANSADRKPETDQIASLSSKIATLTKQRDALIPRLTSASPGQQLTIQAQVNGIQSTLDDNQQQRSSLIVAAAARPSTALLDPVRTPSVPLPMKTKQLAALAGLLGMIGGLGLAASLEILRPTLRSPKAISNAVGAPVIGHLTLRDLVSPARAVAMTHIADRMALLGLRHESSLAILLSVRLEDQPLAVEMAEAWGPNGNLGSSHRLQCVALNGQWVEPGDHPAIVIFSPTKVRARQLRQVQELMDSVDWPVLGVVAYQRPRRFRRHRKPAEHAVNAANAANTANTAYRVADPVTHSLARGGTP